ncbi:hypothetical protein KR074_007448 [Drosophila pseudoananassae]|nr:hypothetical protein KR074_007448 [Drosophila pseudoananassae]
MLALVVMLICNGFIGVIGYEKDSTDEKDYLEPRVDVGKCSDFCHLKYIPYLLCKDEDDNLVKNPWETCHRGYCDKDKIKLKYVTNDGTKKRENYVPKTRVGQSAYFKYLCLDQRGLPQKLKCELRDGDRKWEDEDKIRCHEPLELSSHLNLLVTEKPPDMIPKLNEILNHSNATLKPVDISSIAEIIKNSFDIPDKKASMATHLIGISLKVMETEKETLRMSAELNATNTLLINFEENLNALAPKLLSEIRESDPSPAANDVIKSDIFWGLGVKALISSNLSVFFVNPDIANVTGISLHWNDKSSQWSYNVIYSSNQTENIRNLENLETAAFLPDKLWQEVKKKGAKYLIFKVYKQDVLFVEMEEELHRRPTSVVISITISGWHEHNLPEKLPIFLRNGNTDPNLSEGGCGYWNYATWLSDGVSTLGSADSNFFNNSMILCFADHLTQFTFLLGVGGRQTVTPDIHDYILDILTNVGLFLSLGGIFIIFLTAIVFRHFRRMASTKILLNFCFALAIQLIVFLVVSNVKILDQVKLKERFNIDECIFMGALMQYLLLVVFIWMLIIAFLQFKRYVTVVGVSHPDHYILMSAIVAWTLPLVPTLLVVFLDGQSYIPTDPSQELPIICYPSGRGLGLGVILPIGLVTSVNTLIVGFIFWKVDQNLIQRKIKIQMRLFALQFFLLGISWIFGLFVVLGFGIVFSYLFCITTPLQGFILFLYFVAFKKDNQMAWMRLCCLKSRKNLIRETDTSDIPMDPVSQGSQNTLSSMRKVPN